MNWTLWLKHNRGDGWHATMENTTADSFDRAMTWAQRTVAEYQLSEMVYTVCRDGEHPEKR